MKQPILVILCLEYSEIEDEGGDEELPMGEEFQTLLACFDGDRPKKLINTLWCAIITVA